MKWFWRAFVVLMVIDIIVIISEFCVSPFSFTLNMAVADLPRKLWVFWFWKQFAVLAAINILFMFMAYLNVNRYSWGNNGYILDKVTGKVYPIEDRIAKEEMGFWKRIVERFRRRRNINN